MPKNWRKALTAPHSTALLNYELAVDSREEYEDLSDALRAHRENVEDTADEMADRGEWFRVEKGDALDFYDALVKANKGSTDLKTIVIPIDVMHRDELIELPRSSFTKEEFDSLDVYDQEEIHINDPQSAQRIDSISGDLINRIDWIDDPIYTLEEDSEFFSEGLPQAIKDPDFLEHMVPDSEDNIGDLIKKYGPELGVPRVEKELLEYLGDADYYEKSHDDFYYPTHASSYFQIAVGREFYIVADDIEFLREAYPDEIIAAVAKVNEDRHGFLDDVDLPASDLIKMSKEGGEFQKDLDPTESFSYTPKWEEIVELIEGELNEEMPDIPASSDTRSYEERKLYTFKDGAYWVELTTDELVEEGDRMRNCVGDPDEGYPRGIHNREIRLYSLRTASGRSKIDASFYMGRRENQGDWREVRVKDVKGKDNRQIGWTKGSEGEGKVKWMEIQKVGKLFELLGFDPEEFAPDAGMTAAHDAMRELGGNAAALTQNPASFSWHCPAPPQHLEDQALAETDYGIVDYITDHAEEVTPDEFAEAVGGWEVVRRDWYGGFASEGSLEADAEFMRNDWSVSWYKSNYPDGTPVVFHTASGIEHVYEDASSGSSRL